MRRVRPLHFVQCLLRGHAPLSPTVAWCLRCHCWLPRDPSRPLPVLGPEHLAILRSPRHQWSDAEIADALPALAPFL